MDVYFDAGVVLTVAALKTGILEKCRLLAVAVAYQWTGLVELSLTSDMHCRCKQRLTYLEINLHTRISVLYRERCSVVLARNIE